MRNWRSDNLVTGIIHQWLSTRRLWRLCMKLEGVKVGLYFSLPRTWHVSRGKSDRAVKEAD